jgi:hypothetical protein
MNQGAREPGSQGAREPGSQRNEASGRLGLRFLLQEHAVRNGGDFFRSSPRGLQRGQLALQGAALRVLVGGHLERETIHQGKPGQQGLGFAPDAAPAPERALGDVERQSLGVGGGRVVLDRVARVGKPAPGAAHGDRGHPGEVSLRIGGIFQLGHRVAHHVLAGVGAVEHGEELPGHVEPVIARKRRQAAVMPNLQPPGLPRVWSHQRGVIQMPGPDHRRLPAIAPGDGKHPVALPVNPEPGGQVIPEVNPGEPAPGEIHRPLAPREPAASQPEHGIAPGGGKPAAQQAAIAPGGNLRLEGGTDPDQGEAFGEVGQTDVVGGIADSGGGKAPLAFFDRLPALVERREVPALAGRTDDPEPPLPRVERQPGADGERRQDGVGAEIGVAKEARTIHGVVGYWPSAVSPQPPVAEQTEGSMKD